MAYTQKQFDKAWAGLKPGVKTYMLRPDTFKGHIDILTGELNTTFLAEDAAQWSDIYITDNPAEEMKIPDEVFDLALDVEKELVRRGEVEAIP